MGGAFDAPTHYTINSHKESGCTILLNDVELQVAVLCLLGDYCCK